MITTDVKSVVKVLANCFPQGALAGDIPLIASVQSVSNSLRHARRYGWVTSSKPNPKVNRSIWRVTPEGINAVSEKTP